jgi:hypothetical protein
LQKKERDAIANGCERKMIKGDAGGKFIKVKREVK